MFPSLSQSLGVNAIEILSQVECLMFRVHLGIHLNMTQALYSTAFSSRQRLLFKDTTLSTAFVLKVSLFSSSAF